MKGLLVDSNVLLDVFEDDPTWADWSEAMLDQFSRTHLLCINPIIYAEVSVGFQRIEELELALAECHVRMLQIPKEALFLAAKVFLGSPTSICRCCNCANYLQRTGDDTAMHSRETGAYAAQ